MTIDETTHTPQDSKDWTEDRRLVLYELRRLGKSVEKIDDKLDKNRLVFEHRISKIHTEVVTLKVKSSTWGAIGGAIFGILGALLIKLLG